MGYVKPHNSVGFTQNRRKCRLDKVFKGLHNVWVAGPCNKSYQRKRKDHSSEIHVVMKHYCAKPLGYNDWGCLSEWYSSLKFSMGELCMMKSGQMIMYTK